MNQITLASSDSEIAQCFPIMQELRPHLVQAEFVNRIRRLEQYGYRLAYLESGGNIKAVAGFRISESLALSKFLYVDDLVTTASDRSLGYGEALIDWLVDYAKSHSCQQLHLDSGVQRFAAHRFYFKKRLEITSHHFSLQLSDS